MTRIILVSALSSLMVACAPGLVVPEGCNGRPKSVTVKYGDGGIIVVPRKQVKQNSVFVIKLKPTSNDYKDNVVKIDGKSVTPGGVGVEPPDWLDTSDAYNTRKKFVYCTPELPNETHQDYAYSVEVVDLGMIDPRVEVTW